MKAKLFLLCITLGLLGAMLAGCSSTRTTLVAVDSPFVNPARPAAINCPPVSIKVTPGNEDDLISKQSHTNLKTCLNDTVRYVDDAQTLMDFYEAR